MSDLPPTLPALPASLTRWPGFTLAKVAELGFAFYEGALAQLGIHRHHLAVLGLIAELEPVHQTRLRHLLLVSRATMSHVVADLDELGAVVRDPDPADGRAQLLRLTPSGRRLLRRGEEISAQATDAFFAPLTSDERVLLRDLLDRVATRAPRAEDGRPERAGPYA
jgi:DNA-binding MarR family transcriptional regulator